MSLRNPGRSDYDPPPTCSRGMPRHVRKVSLPAMKPRATAHHRLRMIRLSGFILTTGFSSTAGSVHVDSNKIIWARLKIFLTSLTIRLPRPDNKMGARSQVDDLCALKKCSRRAPRGTPRVRGVSFEFTCRGHFHLTQLTDHVHVPFPRGQNSQIHNPRLLWPSESKP